METGTLKPKTFSIEAVVYPSCVKCGEAWNAHGSCGGYVPSKPITQYGTVAFQSPDMVANLLFRIEQFFQKLRRMRLRSL